MPLARRMISLGPVDNDQYKQLRKVAQVNGFDSVETMLVEMIEDMSYDEDCHRWVAVALTKADYDYAAGRWEDDYRVMLDQVMGDALDGERMKAEAATRQHEYNR